MKSWFRVSHREWEYIDSNGLVRGVVEETSPGNWEWDGETITDFGVESDRARAMDRIEEIVNPTVH